jgi:hypothetical protein
VGQVGCNKILLRNPGADGIDGAGEMKRKRILRSSLCVKSISIKNSNMQREKT